jgi:hypothetical protein
LRQLRLMIQVRHPRQVRNSQPMRQVSQVRSPYVLSA